MNRIITISREFGSGGRELGRRLSDKLGYAYYDQEIISEIVQRTELSEKYVRDISERRPPITAFPIHTGRSFYMPQNPAWTQSQMVHQEQHRIVQEVANLSDCIIVGRCADYVLKDMDPYRIFVYADMDSKLRRCRDREESAKDLSDKELQRKIKTVDRRRAQYYEFYTDQGWGERVNYDLLINTTNRSVKEAAKMIVKLFED